MEEIKARSLEEAIEIHKPFSDCELTTEYLDMVSLLYETSREKHHILPRSIYPQYAKAKWNIATLPYQQHFRAHEILPFIVTKTQHKVKMVLAWDMMSSINRGGCVSKITSEQYAELKTIKSNVTSKRVSGAGNAMFGKTHTPEARKVISSTHLGVPRPRTLSSINKFIDTCATIDFEGGRYSFNSLTKKFKIHRKTVVHRVKKGMQLKDALRLHTSDARGGLPLEEILLDQGFKFVDGIWYSKEDSYDLVNTYMPTPRKRGKILTDQEIADIKNRLLSGESQTTLAKQFGVGATCINNIKQRSTKQP